MISSLEVQMIVVIVLVVGHDIALPELGQDPLLPARHLRRGLRRGGGGQRLRGVERHLELLLVIHAGAGVEMIISLEKIKLNCIDIYGIIYPESNSDALLTP